MDREKINKIKEEIKLKINEVHNMNELNDIKVEYLGSYCVVSLHIELDENLTFKESHEIVHRAQNNVLKKVPLVKSITIHGCPVGIEYNHNQEIDK